MKKALTKNLGLKVLALVFSALLWLLVMNMENPIMKKTFTGIPVEVIHGEVITNKAKTYQVSDDTKTVSVEIEAKRKTLNSIRSEDIKAIADMRNLTNNSLVEINVTVPKYVIEDAKATPANVQVSIDANKSRKMAITAVTSGTLRDGYVLGEVKADPEKVEISGPETLVNSISKVVAEVDVSGLSQDEELNAELIMYDANNKIIDSTMLETNIGQKGTIVKVSVKKTAAVKLDFDTSLVKAAAGYQVEEITIEPQTVRISGTTEQLASISNIEIPAGVLAVSGLEEKTEKNIPLEEIAEYLPDWAEVIEDNPGNIVVTIGISMQGTKNFEVPFSSIYLKNVPTGFKAVLGTTGSVEIVVQGPEEELEKLELDQSDVSVNLLTYTTAGTYEVPLEVNLPEKCSLVSNNYTIQITMEKQ
ncbi:CdaR family protein [Bariatricus massiliensis]|uniref:YbbR-like protein n=1 Tax=Bariatricus massiliensis TaxID=1745713 RepID=A0ABS8DIW3_9FIRM|nr:CdaR family protein [Bariatricus massiliensis]MCB7305227.1 hypothetical protein [Bariatricus massiliensis]MCB7375880.1 hypothetical protein [Bariatricus massiliensis]MCB7388370.1 hypothetical protein [Bariatricus massiliensis]MCB7412642.1 hypothetical protein [Bariatricus massiliensis]MCQ5254720.1 CdaR family protein [Bariatricus massiliensis]